MKKNLTMKSLLGNLLFIAILLLIISRFFSVWTGTAFPINIISSESMHPTLFEGDLIAWTPEDINEIRIGDVIVFRSWLHWPEERHVIHRVIDIKTMNGKPAFATKGDANNYTDQKGPHIVEPYVTEENFVGRAISLGQIPLKIPFIGIFGIMVNQGFESLSQPSVGKGSLAFIGIYTPLTIAVILFIVSLVILPQKTKTLREKIRLFIFGEKMIKAKQTFLFFLIIYIVFFSVIHIFAYDQTSASLGVNIFPEKSSFSLGSVTQGSTTLPKNLPAFNPSIFPVKGIVLGGGALGGFINRDVFSLHPGETQYVPVTATVGSEIINGAYEGFIVLYSSPLWFLFPPQFMENVYLGDAQTTVLLFDIVSAGILSTITIILLVGIECIKTNYLLFSIDWSWCHYSKFLFSKKRENRRVPSAKQIKGYFSDKFGWFISLKFPTVDIKKPILVSLIVIPLLFLMNSNLLAMCISSILAGCMAYFVQCKRRNKIVLAATIPVIITISFLILKINYFIFTTQETLIESLSLGLGVVAIYTMALCIFLIPLSLISWYLTRVIRNVKERQDPLLVLEGRCDL